MKAEKDVCIISVRKRPIHWVSVIVIYGRLHVIQLGGMPCRFTNEMPQVD